MTTRKVPLSPARLTRAFGAILLLALAGCQDSRSPTAPLQIEPSMAVIEQTASAPVVNSLADPGTGGCDDTECTLREAIAYVADDGEIGFAEGLSGTIVLTEVLEITRSMTIRGPGAAVLAVSGNSTYRVFSVFPEYGATSMPAVEIHGLTIRDGNSTPYGGYGGGVYMYNSDLSLVGVVVTNNVSTQLGGGIFAEGGLSLTDCLITDNTAVNGGGILHRPDWYGNGFLSVTRTTITGNTATSYGGGVAFWGQGIQGAITLSTIAGNQGRFGGGVHASASDGDLLVTNTTISGNGAEDGGGVYASAGGVLIANSTVSGNTAGWSAGGVMAAGAAMTLTNVTVAANSAANGAGGVYLSYGSLLLRNSLVALNSAPPDYGPDLLHSTSYSLTASYSLIGTPEGHSLTNDVDNNLVGVSPGLSDMADNGGPTLTHALLESSPAIDAGSCTDNTGAPVPTDQRGVIRPQGSGCDIGAYEQEVVAPVFSRSCTYAASPRSGLRKTITVTWENADPGVTLIEIFDGRTVSKAMAPTASGSWSTSLRTESASLTYQLSGGVDRKDRAISLASGTCQEITP